jgi:transposase
MSRRTSPASSILQATPEGALLSPLAQSFRRLSAHGDPDRDPAGVRAWIAAAGASAAPEIRRFAQGLKHDLDAVLAAFRLPWSHGQVEGQVNRLKTLKRQLYGSCTAAGRQMDGRWTADGRQMDGRAGPLLLQRRLCYVV